MTRSTWVFTGPESSGKSYWSQWFAKQTQTTWIGEYAREFLSHTQGYYTRDQVFDMLKEQEHRISKREGCMVICDTDALNFAQWVFFGYGVSPESILSQIPWKTRKYILCYPDIPWEKDPFRESPSPEERMSHFLWQKKQLIRYSSDFRILKGTDIEKKALLKQFIREEFLDR